MRPENHTSANLANIDDCDGSRNLALVSEFRISVLRRQRNRVLYTRTIFLQNQRSLAPPARAAALRCIRSLRRPARRGGRTPRIRRGQPRRPAPQPIQHHSKLQTDRIKRDDAAPRRVPAPCSGRGPGAGNVLKRTSTSNSADTGRWSLIVIVAWLAYDRCFTVTALDAMWRIRSVQAGLRLHA